MIVSAERRDLAYLRPSVRMLALSVSVFLTASCDSVAPSDLLSESDLDERDEIAFADPALEARVREVLGITAGAVTAEDMERLTALSRVGGAIGNLTGLEHAVNLEQLYLPDNDVEDLRPLSELSALRRLNLSGNEISDLAPLAGLTGLEHLDLDGNELSDLAPLSGLTALRSLELENVGVTALDALAGLVNLETLFLAENEISDVSPLNGLEALQILDLSANKIADAGPLGTNMAPVGLILDDNPITDVSFLVRNTGLAAGPSHITLRNVPLSEDALCDQVPSLQDAGVIVRGAGACPSGAGPVDAPWLRTDRDLYLSARHAIWASFDNLGDVVLHGNKCSADPEWEFQLQLERRTDGDWAVAHDPVALTCLGYRALPAGVSVAFKAFPVGAATGTYRLVWPRVYVDEDMEETLPLSRRVSAPFSVVAP